LVVASKKIGKEVNADRTKYMIMAREQNAGRSHSIKIDSSPYESVDVFKYLATNLTYQSSIDEEIKRRFISGNACYKSVQNIFHPGCYAKIKDEYIHKYNFACYFVWV